MQTARRRTARPILTLAALAALVSLSSLAASRPAEAFQVGQSPDFAACAIWFNDQGQPLRNKSGREIGRQVPCPGQERKRDAYEVLPGETPGTLVIHDASHHFECILVLTPGSATVMAPKVCQAWKG